MTHLLQAGQDDVQNCWFDTKQKHSHYHEVGVRKHAYISNPLPIMNFLASAVSKIASITCNRATASTWLTPNHSNACLTAHTETHGVHSLYKPGMLQRKYEHSLYFLDQIENLMDTRPSCIFNQQVSVLSVFFLCLLCLSCTNGCLLCLEACILAGSEGWLKHNIIFLI